MADFASDIPAINSTGFQGTTTAEIQNSFGTDFQTITVDLDDSAANLEIVFTASRSYLYFSQDETSGKSKLTLVTDSSGGATVYIKPPSSTTTVNVLVPFTELERDITFAYNGAWLEKTDDEPLPGRVSTQLSEPVAVRLKDRRYGSGTQKTISGQKVTFAFVAETSDGRMLRSVPGTTVFDAR